MFFLDAGVEVLLKLGVLLCAWLVGLAGLLSMVSFEVRSFILASTLEVIDLY